MAHARVAYCGEPHYRETQGPYNGHMPPEATTRSKSTLKRELPTTTRSKSTLKRELPTTNCSMAEVRVDSAVESSRAHSIAGMAIFNLKAWLFRLARGATNLTGPRRFPKASALIDLPVQAKSRTELFTGQGPKENRLTAGKIHNLRQAIRKLDGVEIPAGAVFSFWAQIGKPTRGEGYVAGRELREGCLIPSIGGGLCQISNALYQCALESGLEIVERHAHTQVIPGSATQAGRDATVFWNYVDLRFRSQQPLRIEAKLTSDSLVVRFKKAGRTLRLVPSEGHAGQRAILQFPVRAPASCESCGVSSCFRSTSSKGLTLGRTAFLVDEYWPEFDGYITSNKSADDLMGLPINSRLFRLANYDWNTEGFHQVRTATVATLHRSWAMRNLPAQGAVRQETLLKYEQKLARALGSSLTFDVTHVVVSQNLLPFLWRDGQLGGRTFDVLMTRLPMAVLQRRLDLAHGKHPASTTLSDFRAPDWIIQAENEALSNARSIITPHSQVAKLFAGKAVVLGWQMPSIQHKPLKGNRILFPASALGRKGAYEIREVARLLDLELLVMGSELEGTRFWEGLRVTRVHENWLDGVGLVVLPAYVEDKPRRLLQAIACGIPVIASEACGLEGVEGVTTIPDIEALSLGEAMRTQIECLGIRRETSQPPSRIGPTTE
jgi:hypothetical protein